MSIWIDAQLSPSMAEWIRDRFGVEAHAVRELALRDATDRQIFAAARERRAFVMTKDSGFIGLVNQLGAPPQVIWPTCGNTSNARLRQILSATLGHALDLLASGEPIVEIKDGL